MNMAVKKDTKQNIKSLFKIHKTVTVIIPCHMIKSIKCIHLQRHDSNPHSSLAVPVCFHFASPAIKKKDMLYSGLQSVQIICVLIHWLEYTEFKNSSKW